MALEYRLTLAGTTPLDQVAQRAFPDPAERPAGTESPLSIALYDRYGFAVTVSARRNGYFDVVTDQGSWVWEPEAHVSVTFRMDKEADPEWKVTNMLTVTRRVMQTGPEDAVLILNGDVLLFSRFNGEVVKHRSTGWWENYTGANDLIPG